MRDSQVNSWIRPAKRKESVVSCQSMQCTRACCVVGLMLVLGRGVWVKEIRKITLTS